MQTAQAARTATPTTCSRPGPGAAPAGTRASRTLLLGIAVALAAGACSDARPQAAPNAARPNIVLVVIDSLRRDHLGTYGYPLETSPFIDALASRGIAFEEARAQAPWTLPSISSLFTSRFPGEVNPSVFDGRQLSLTPGYPVLAELMADAGYCTASVAANPYLLPVFDLVRGFELHRFENNAPANHVVDLALELLDERDRCPQGSEAPFFLYLHFMDVHTPNVPPAPFDRLFETLDGAPHQPADRLFAFTDATGLDSAAFEAHRSHKVALYDGSIRFVDTQLSRFAAVLEARGVAKNTVLVVTSDHGEELWDHPKAEVRLGLDNKGRYGVEHGHTLFPELLDVPLVMNGPGIPTARVEPLVRSLDIAPTLLGLAGRGSDSESLAGIDLLRALESDALDSLLALSRTRSRSHLQRSAQDGEFQYLRVDDREFLFKNAAPDTPMVDVSREHPAELERLRSAAEAIWANLGHEEGKPIRFEAELRRELKALGYLE